jgi:hypothetical protein
LAKATFLAACSSFARLSAILSLLLAADYKLLAYSKIVPAVSPSSSSTPEIIVSNC